MCRCDGAEPRLKIQARVARTGVQDYGDHVEHRDAAEVFAPASMASWVGAPLTIGHQGWMTPSNVAEHAVGYVESVERESFDDGGTEWIRAVIVVTDAAVIEQLRTGELAEFSAGYAVDVVQESGVADGTPYDAIQKNINVNHLGIGGRGWARCGYTCSVV